MNAKAAATRHQRQVLELSRLPGNDICADCTGRNPRWASHNLGIFICLNCAGIHRKMGTHISKVKSLTLDEWSREQIAVMKDNGNTKSNAYFNPDERRNRPPANIQDVERDSELERFIRAKYEFRRFMDKRPPPLPRKDPPSPVNGHRSMTVSNGSASRSGTLAAPSSSSSVARGIARSSTAPIIPSSWREAKRAASPLPTPPRQDSPAGPSSSSSTAVPPPRIAVSSPGYPAGASSSNAANGVASLSNGAPSSMPIRASSALAYSSGSATTTPTLSSSGTGSSHTGGSSMVPLQSQQQQQSFQGRSSVFDDLLEMSKPIVAPPPQPQQMGYSNPYGQQEIMSSLQMGMNSVGLHQGAPSIAPTNMANPWASYQQPAVTSPMGLSAGAMGYQHTNGMGMQQQQPQSTGYFLSAGGPAIGGQWSPSDLGGMAFGTSPHTMMGVNGPSSNGYNPYLAQQSVQQQYTQSYAGFSSSPAAGFPTQAYQPQQPQPQQTGNVFDDWARGMMPGNK